MESNRSPVDPTPAEIAAACAAIRATWSPAEAEARRQWVPRFGARDWQLVSEAEAARRGKAG